MSTLVDLNVASSEEKAGRITGYGDIDPIKR